MSRIAIIPARGGSKRIPRKNIRDFLGKPIISYSVKAAIESELFDEVMVSTDDNEIAEIAANLGAKVPFIRSEQNSNDIATTASVLIEVINEYKHRHNKSFEYGCCIYPTAPLIKKEHLKNGYNILANQHFNTVFPVVAFGYPVWRGIEVSEGGKAKMLWPEYLNARSQDLKKVFHDAGQWYWFSVAALLENNALFTSNSGVIQLEENEVQDIDNLVDWNLAEMKYKLLNH